jgi:transposase InsO family protein
MSKARLVIAALFVEGQSPAEVARRYGVHRSWVYRLEARYEAEGTAAAEPRSRRPRRSPRATPPDVVEAIIQLRDQLTTAGHDAGPDTIAWHLARQGIRVSPATIARKLTAAGKVTRQPRKRPRASYVRFAAELPNQTWQADFTHYRLADGTGTGTGTGTEVEILTWLDDHSRYALRVSAHRRVSGLIVRAAFRAAVHAAVHAHGVPASTLTDNGLVFTTRFAGGRGDRNGLTALEHELRRLHVAQKNSRPNHPTTCGKVERFQQTLKNWLRAQPTQPATTEALQALLDQFTDHYNHRRPHRSLPQHATPATRYQALPKALPAASRDPDTHHRIRHDRIDDTGTLTLRHAGRLHHIGIGRTHARTHVILLIADLDIRIINATTGELLRELTLNPHRDYQPQQRTTP